jgi:hypothetical protein
MNPATGVPAGWVPGNPLPPAFVGGFGSRHPGITIIGFGDGSVRNLSNSITLKILQQLGHRSDGKLLSDGDF